MVRVFVLGLIAACGIGVVAAAQQQQEQQPPIFRGARDLVRVFATVTDRDGRLVPNLARDVFEVRDEGKPQPIVEFDASSQPIRLIVLLDVSSSMQGNLQLLRQASQELFRRLRPDDVARVGTFGRDIVISPTFTHDARELTEALPREIRQDAPTPLWRAVQQALDGFGEGDTRKVILVLSDGKDTGPLSLREKPISQAEIIDLARRDDVMVYAVGMRSRGGPRPMPGIGPGAMQAMVTADLPDPLLARVAEETGGGYLEIRPGEDLAAAFAAVADELHAQYLLGFEPPKRDGKVHGISLKIAQPGMKARGRKNYLAPDK